MVEEFHVPAIPLVDVVGSRGTSAPVQMVSSVPKSNTGVIVGVTFKTNVVVLPHCPAAGVNVYVPEFLLSNIAGLQVPEILFIDVAGRTGTSLPEQIVIAVPKVNVGVTMGVTVTVNVAVVAH